MYKDMMHRETEILKELMGIKSWRDNYNSCAKTYKKRTRKAYWCRYCSCGF